MKIIQMTATFGRLNRQTLKLEEGLNILQAKNEGGKSTWAGFLRAMLYGIDSRDRDKKGHLAEKNRYLPWSGAPMEGELRLQWQGRDITIHRGRKGNAPFGAFSAVYTATGEPVPGMTGDNCGQMLTGVSREVFERSAFIGQSAVTINSAPELEKRIAALVSSGEEDVSYSQAESRLKEWANRRRVNKTVGMIPRLEQELEQVRRDREHQVQVSAAVARGESELAQLNQARQELEGDQFAYRRLAQRELNRRFAQAQEETDRAQAALENWEREQARFGQLPEKELLKKAQGELQYLKVLTDEIKQGEEALKQAEEDYVQANIAIQDEHFNSLTGQAALERAAEDARAYADKQAARKKRKQRALIFFLLGGLCLAAGLGAMAALQYGVLTLPPSVPGLVLPAAGGALCALFWLLAVVWLVRSNGAGKQAAQIPTRYGVETPEQITALAEDYAVRWQKAEECAARQKEIHGALNDRKARRENGRNDLFDFVHSFAPEVRDLFGISAALSRALGLEDRIRESRDKLELTRRRRDDLAAQGGQLMDTLEMIHTPQRSLEEVEADLDAVNAAIAQVSRALDMARGELKAAGDPAGLEQRQAQLEQQLERRTGEHQAITIALEALKAANGQLQERFSPELNRLAGEYMQELTAGRYTSVSLNRELEAQAADRENLLPRSALALSKGTVDQLYLAVRLAVCRLCLPEEACVPLVLDDALVTFDDDRAALALKCLTREAEQRQVLLFTCHSREAAMVRDGKTGLTGVVTLLEEE